MREQGNAPPSGQQRKRQSRIGGIWQSASRTTRRETSACKKRRPQALPSDSRNALASIDRQAPSLTYLGLGCWIAWNTIAFSGSFWLHETDNNNITENLMLVHLLACFITLSLVALVRRPLLQMGREEPDHVHRRPCGSCGHTPHLQRA